MCLGGCVALWSMLGGRNGCRAGGREASYERRCPLFVLFVKLFSKWASET